MRPILTSPPAMMRPGFRPITTPPAMRPIPIRRPRFYGLNSTRPLRPSKLYGLGDVSSNQPAIADTGMRGFLKWLQREYPPAIYQDIAARIQQHIPQAFSSYMLGGWRKFARLNGLADGTTGTVDTADAANSTPADVSWANAISQIIGTSTGAYLNLEQQQNQNAIIQTQLQQAQAGGKPLNVSLGASGISFTSPTALTVGSLALIGGLGFLALKAFKVI